MDGLICPAETGQGWLPATVRTENGPTFLGRPLPASLRPTRSSLPVNPWLDDRRSSLDADRQRGTLHRVRRGERGGEMATRSCGTLLLRCRPTRRRLTTRQGSCEGECRRRSAASIRTRAADPGRFQSECDRAGEPTATSVATCPFPASPRARHRPAKDPISCPATNAPGTVRVPTNAPVSPGASSKVIAHSSKSSQRPVKGNHALKTLSFALKIRRSQAISGRHTASLTTSARSSGRSTAFSTASGSVRFGSASTPIAMTDERRATTAARYPSQ